MDQDPQVPSWSGVPTFLGADKNIAVIPLHVADTRAFQLDGYQHIDYYESLDGEVEYHVYERLRVYDVGGIAVPVPAVSEPVTGQGPADLRRAIPVDETASRP